MIFTNKNLSFEQTMDAIAAAGTLSSTTLTKQDQLISKTCQTDPGEIQQ